MAPCTWASGGEQLAGLGRADLVEILGPGQPAGALALEDDPPGALERLDLVVGGRHHELPAPRVAGVAGLLAAQLVDQRRIVGDRLDGQPEPRLRDHGCSSPARGYRRRRRWRGRCPRGPPAASAPPPGPGDRRWPCRAGRRRRPPRRTAGASSLSGLAERGVGLRAGARLPLERVVLAAVARPGIERVDDVVAARGASSGMVRSSTRLSGETSTSWPFGRPCSITSVRGRCC